MTNHLLEWHLSRDSRIKLFRFCEKNKVRQESTKPFKFEGIEGEYFYVTYYFDNGAWLKVELRAGDTKSYSINDHFQVCDYQLGTK